MAIDSIRLLVDSAGPLWRRLDTYSSLEDLPVSDTFDDWIARSPYLSRVDGPTEQQLRRDYRRLHTLLNELETLLCSRPLALAMVRERSTELALAE